MPTAKRPKIAKKRSKVAKKPVKKYLLRLYIAGKTRNCVEAYDNLKKLCDELVPNIYTIEIIDLLKLPQLAKSDQIIAIPTVIKKLPAPMRRIIGNLSDKEKVMLSLDFTLDR